MHPPKIFISATSGDLRPIRQIVKEALLTINCHPVEQTNFEPDARTVENMLRGKIGDCQALIHICGLRYGAEPDVATLPPGTPRRSYTQMEYHIGRQLQEQRGDDHFRVYTFICPEDFPYDVEPDTEPQEKRDLQLAHRSLILADPHLREKPQGREEIQLRILSLQEQVHTLKAQQGGIGRMAKAIFIALVVLSITTLIGFSWLGSKDQAPRPRVLDKGEKSVVVVMGEDVEYEKKIRDSFIEHLRSGLADRGYKLNFETFNPGFEPGSYAAPDPIGHDTQSHAGRKWSHVLNDIEFKISRRKVDYFITLGTYATEAIKQAGMHTKHDSQLIYLGVTDPVEAKFTGNPDTAGVQYGTGGKDYGRMMDSLFKPDHTTRQIFLAMGV